MLGKIKQKFVNEFNGPTKKNLDSYILRIIILMLETSKTNICYLSVSILVKSFYLELSKNLLPASWLIIKCSKYQIRSTVTFFSKFKFS